jgi:aspartyl/asparaginyl beta-hydroxylase (cupin superfamily)
MNDDLATTTQKIIFDLEQQITRAEEQQSQQATINTQNHLRWLRSKLQFYKSKWYPVYKEQNQ